MQPTNIQVVLRFKKADYFSISPKQIFSHSLVANFFLRGFDLEFFNFAEKAILFFNDGEKDKVAKIKNYLSIIENGIVTLYLEIHNVVDKEIWEREFLTEEYFYNEYVLGMNKFWLYTGDKLDALVKPLGLCKKSYENDSMFKRRIMTYLQNMIKPTDNTMEMLDRDLKNLANKGDKK